LIHDDQGRWRLVVSAEYADPPLAEPTDVLGVDLGIVNIAADSDGTVYSGATLIGLRIRHRAPVVHDLSAGTTNDDRKDSLGSGLQVAVRSCQRVQSAAERRDIEQVRRWPGK
jgi:hypothetical protein